MKKKKQKHVLTRSEQMACIRSKDTKPELLLRNILWHRGYRYRKNYKKVYGTPDIVFVKKKIAIFCDSEFWHGKDYLNGKVPKTNQDYWVNKFEQNIERDKRVNTTLKEGGWLVLRFWEKDIYNNLDAIVKSIEAYLAQK